MAREEIGCGAACIVHAPEERATNVKEGLLIITYRYARKIAEAWRSVASPRGAEIGATREPKPEEERQVLRA